MPYPLPVVHPTIPNVNSAVLKDRHTFAPPPWKPLPNCALDVNARRERVATSARTLLLPR